MAVEHCFREVASFIFSQRGEGNSGPCCAFQQDGRSVGHTLAGLCDGLEDDGWTGYLCDDEGRAFLGHLPCVRQTDGCIAVSTKRVAHLLGVQDVGDGLHLAVLEGPAVDADHGHVAVEGITACRFGYRGRWLVVAVGIAADGEPRGWCPLVDGTFLEGQPPGSSQLAVDVEARGVVLTVVDDDVMRVVGGEGSVLRRGPKRLGIRAVSLVALRHSRVADVAFGVHLQAEAIAVDESQRTGKVLGQSVVATAIDLDAVGIRELAHGSRRVAQEVFEELRPVSAELCLVEVDVGIEVHGHFAHHDDGFVAIGGRMIDGSGGCEFAVHDELCAVGCLWLGELLHLVVVELDSRFLREGTAIYPGKNEAACRRCLGAAGDGSGGGISAKADPHALASFG